ncbi:MAG: DUF4404 family protein [Woeseiaceae bacterium]|nr:DUF4404 family protein [Woeseiaceae bacterium]
MSNDKLRQLLADLQDELRDADVDDDTRDSLRRLDHEIHDLLEASRTSPDPDEVFERARLLEARFAIRHPTAERFMREVIDTLGKIGI